MNKKDALLEVQGGKPLEVQGGFLKVPELYI